jgi:hypothetical protein
MIHKYFYYLFIILFRVVGCVLHRKNIYIISGADSSHFKSLLQLINSIHAINPSGVTLKIYDLGLEINEINYFKNLHPKIPLLKFDYANYPDYFDIKVNSGEYAWKSQVFKMEFDKTRKGEFLLWLDAGCFIRKKILLIKASLLFYGFYSPLSGGSIKKLTHPQTIEELCLHQYAECQMLSAGLIGVKNSPINKMLIDEWSKHSFKKSIIAPCGSNRSNHRQDQSLFSLLLYSIYRIKKLPYFTTKWREILPHRDIG